MPKDRTAPKRGEHDCNRAARGRSVWRKAPGVKASVRPLGGAELLRGVDRLRTLVYPEFPEAREPERHAAVWGWLARHPLAAEMHRWVVVAEDGDEVVGHLAAVPQRYRILGTRVVAHTPADYQILPGYGFYALSLMRRFFGVAENCVCVDQVAEAIAIEERMGAERAGRLQYAAKGLDFSRPTRIPAALRPAMKVPTWGLRAVDRALGTAFGRGPAVEPLFGFGGSSARLFDGLSEEVAAEVPCAVEKDAAFLRWRYGPGSPPHLVTILGAVEGGDLLGYAVLWVNEGDGDGYLLDLTTRPGRWDAARSLVREAVRFFARSGAYIVRYRFAESPTSPRPEDLRRLGFFFREGRRHTMLVRFADPDLHATALDVANWSYSAGDGEATFWAGRPAGPLDSPNGPAGMG